jgi:adenylosuccinate synthase
MPATAIVGINWGDEGKGRMVDLFASEYDVVVRYQGGNNAGHTVVNRFGKFALNLIPSGIFSAGVRNVLGNGVVIDLEHLCGEVGRVREAGIPITPENFFISQRAIICFPYHRDQDVFEEERLKGAKYGSTRRGIAPVYGDKYLKKGIQMGELLQDDDYLRARLSLILEWKNLFIQNTYGKPPYTVDGMLGWLRTYGDPFKEYIHDARCMLTKAQRAGENILFEAQLGALRDIDYGIYPYTTSSSPLAAYAPIGSGAPGIRFDDVIGIVKAYSTCVGEGPFVVETFGEEADRLREAGEEYGATTGRPRRVGPFDAVASRYGVQVQGATRLALTKLDVLSCFETIPVCTAYEIGGRTIRDFPFAPLLAGARPVLKRMPGWGTDISGVRRWEDLPGEAQRYVEFTQDEMECRIDYVSVGPDRDAIIRR